MTDARLGALGREALVAEAGELRVGGLVREALVAGTVVGPPIGQRQYAVTVISTIFAVAVMSGLVFAAGMYLVLLHRADGGEVLLNPAQVVSLHSAALEGKNRHFTSAALCTIGLTDGKWLSVVEGCETVRGLLEEAGRR